MPFLHDSDSGKVFDGRDVSDPTGSPAHINGSPNYSNTHWADVADLAAALDRERGVDPQSNDSALAIACHVYSQAHLVEGAGFDTSAYLAGIASGVVPPTNPWLYDHEGNYIG